MALALVKNIPRLHTTPLASIQISDSRVITDVDDEHERRVRLIFEPYQAVRMTTADCYRLPDGVSLVPNRVMEVLTSSWVAELTTNLKHVDVTAAFMTKARHFIVPLQDDFLEVVAWDVALAVAT